MTLSARSAPIAALVLGLVTAGVVVRHVGDEGSRDPTRRGAAKGPLSVAAARPDRGPHGARQDARTVRSYADSAPATWHLEEELAVESPANTPFVGLLVDAHGRFFVRSERPDRIHVYDRGGAPVRSFPDPTAGEPSALDDVRGMTWGPGAELWIVEGDRFAVFDTAGRFRRELPRRSNANARRWEGAGFDSAGRLYDKGFAGGAHDPALFRIAADGHVADTVRLPFVLPRYFAPGADDRMRRILRGADTARPDSTSPEAAGRPRPRSAAVALAGYPIPHSPEAIWAFDPEGWLWVARSDAYRIHRRRLAGDTVLTVRREARRRPVTPEEKLEIQRRMERRGEVPDTAGIPSGKPILASLHVDRDGRLWVELAADRGSPTVYDVYARDGTYLARVRAGVRIRVTPPLAHGTTLDYVGPPPGTWPRPEPGDLTPITNHLVRTRLVDADPAPRESGGARRDGPGDRAVGGGVTPDPGEAPAPDPTRVARLFWRAWAAGDSAVMRRYAAGLPGFAPGRRARVDSVSVAGPAEPAPERPGPGRTPGRAGDVPEEADRIVVGTRLGMSAGRSSFVVPLETTLVHTAEGWRVDGLATTRALALAYTEVVVQQLLELGDVLDSVRSDPVRAPRDTGGRRPRPGPP